MLIFGHTGITLGAVVLLNSILARYYTPGTGENKGKEHLASASQMPPTQDCSVGGRAPWGTLLRNIDMRLLLIGSLLPDIIDKPMGQFFFRDTFSNGRIFCHTLLFLLLLTLIGVFLYRSRRKTWLLILSFGTFTHLIFDQMWLVPRTLLWPLYGFTFEKCDLTHWVQNMLYALRFDPGTYAPELVGAAILIWFALALVGRRQVYTFITNGQVL